MAPPRVSVLVVSYNSAACIGACLESLRPEARRIALEVIVADSASSDDTCAIVRRGFPEVELLALGENRGFSAAVNAAARRGSGEHLLLLNSDTRVRPGAVAALWRALDRDPPTAIAGPRLVRPDGRAELSAGAMPSLGSELGRKLLAILDRRRVGLVAWILDRWTREERHPDWVSGACLLIRRSVFAALGGMDEGYFMYFEDTDLCARARAAGHRILFTPTAEVVHEGGVSVRSAEERVAREYRRSQLRFYARHRGVEETQALRLYLGLSFRLQWCEGLLGGNPEQRRVAGERIALLRGAEVEGAHDPQS